MSKNISLYFNSVLLGFSSGGSPVKNSKSPGNRILVRTCDGLELRDPPYYPSGDRGELTMSGEVDRYSYQVHGGGGRSTANNRGFIRVEPGGGGSHHRDKSIFDDITTSFYNEMPPQPARPKSALSKFSHQSFKSMRSLNGDQVNK